jgi:hypothetical protein
MLIDFMLQHYLFLQHLAMLIGFNSSKSGDVDRFHASTLFISSTSGDVDRI